MTNDQQAEIVFQVWTAASIVCIVCGHGWFKFFIGPGCFIFGVFTAICYLNKKS